MAAVRGRLSAAPPAPMPAIPLGERADEIDGILVTLPNFGDERGVANAIRLSGLDVPVLVQAFQLADELAEAMEALVAARGRLDVVVNCAAIVGPTATPITTATALATRPTIKATREP